MEVTESDHVKKDEIYRKKDGKLVGLQSKDAFPIQSSIQFKDRKFGLVITTGRTKKVTVVKIADLGHFGCKIVLLLFLHLTQNLELQS